MARRDLTGAVDFLRLETYAAGDRTLIEEVLGLFDEQRRLWMRLIEADDPSAARDAAHAMKGAALGIGADGLAQACSALELEPDAALLPRRAAQVRNEVERACGDIAAYRHELLLQDLKTGR